MWVEGDEAFHSRDSNTFGSVSSIFLFILSPSPSRMYVWNHHASPPPHRAIHSTHTQVPLGLVNAKVTFILWPLSRFGPVARVVKPDRVIFSAASKNSFNEDPDLWL